MKRYEFIEHTADIRVRVYGNSLEDLFKNSAIALFKLIISYESKGERQRAVTLEADTLEELLINWLNELISNFFAYKFLPASYQIKIDGKEKKILNADIKGDKFNPYKNKINMEVKAATYHNLKIEKDIKGYKAEIIFDV